MRVSWLFHYNIYKTAPPHGGSLPFTPHLNPPFNLHHHHSHTHFSIFKIPKVEEGMGTEAPSWAEQWGAGGIGAMEEEQDSATAANKKESKGENKAGLARVKAAAATGALKVKNGASTGVKWIKNKCTNKKPSPKS